MLARPTSIAIVDDHALFRKVLKNYLSEQQDLSVSFGSPDIVDLISKLKNLPVDLLIMDLFMPGMSGADALKLIKNEFPSVKIVVLSMSSDMDLVSDLLDAGIHAYVSKSAEPEELLHAIRTAAENKIFRNKLFTEALYYNRQNNLASGTDKSEVELTDREKKMLQLMWEEKSNKEIADELFLGVRSVEKIRQDMKEKVGARSTVGLLKYGIRRKIIGAFGPFLRSV